MYAFKRLFNIFACLIRTILDKTGEAFFEEFSAISQDKKDEIQKELEIRLPELFHEGNVMQLSILSCSDTFFKNMEAVYAGELDESRIQLLVVLITKLDIILKKCVENYTTSEPIKGINTNIEQTRIQLLPRVTCEWEHNSRGASHSNDLMNYLKFFYFIDKDKTDGYEIESYFLSGNTFEAAKRRKYLNIGMSPVSNQGILEYKEEIRDGTGYFSITGVGNSDIIDENLLELEEEARQLQVDILITPEMLAGPQTLEKLSSRLSEFPEDEKDYPSITIAPSRWENNHNKSVVLDQSGDHLIEQEKQHRYLFTDKGMSYLEDLKPEKKIALIHCEGIGRIAILICKDALMTNYIQMLLNILKVTLLIIPSFSTGNYDFQKIILSCGVADCCVCWINTCSVANLGNVDGDKLDSIGLFLRSGKKSDLENGTYICTRKSQKCDGKGVRDCGHCLFTYQLPFG